MSKWENVELLGGPCWLSLYCDKVDRPDGFNMEKRFDQAVGHVVVLKPGDVEKDEWPCPVAGCGGVVRLRPEQQEPKPKNRRKRKTKD